METAEVVVIGAGFAGASTAYQLVQRGIRDVLVLETEDLPGMHSSGRNAAMARQTIADPALARLAVEGARFLAAPPEEWETRDLLRQSGSLLLARGEERSSLGAIRANCASLGVEVDLSDPEDARRRVAVLEGADFEQAAWCPLDGLVDIHALLMGYLGGVRRAGGRVEFGRPVGAIRTRAGRVAGVETAQGIVDAPVVVNAGGAWAADLLTKSELPSLPLRSYRRHLFVTPPMARVDPGWPFVWDLTHGLYFRPEAGGLLMSACDQLEMPASDVVEDPAIRELLAERVTLYLPGLADVAVRAGWAGLRTFAPDKRFVIGRDPEVEGLVWAAALGGHGMTTSAAVGRLAAEAVVGNDRDPVSDPFSPARLR